MRDYKFLMVYYPHSYLIEEIQNSIDKDDLYLGDGTDDDTYGLEKEPHVTLLPNIDPEVEYDDMEPYLEHIKEYDAILVKTSVFENEKFDVLKFDITNDAFINTNKELSTYIPNYPTFNEYHPHLTIAYLKPGRGKKYVNDMNYKIVRLIPKSFVLSYGDEKEEYYKHTKKKN